MRIVDVLDAVNRHLFRMARRSVKEGTRRQTENSREQENSKDS